MLLTITCRLADLQRVRELVRDGVRGDAFIVYGELSHDREARTCTFEVDITTSEPTGPGLRKL